MTGRADTYNAPRILRMWDSFGHIEHGQAGHAELMQKFDYSQEPASYLRPGDTLIVEIEVDPSFSDEGFTVKWSSIYVDDQAGERLVKFVFPIENRHVERELPIAVRIISHQDWHRHQMWDDFWLSLSETQSCWQLMSNRAMLLPHARGL
jgi:hypothetical protein